MSQELMSRTPSLFEIEQSLAMLMQDRDDVTDPEEVAAVETAIQEYVTKEVTKVDGILAYLRKAEQMQAGAERAAKMYRSHVERLKSAVMTAMQVTGKRRLDGTCGSFILKRNGGLAPLVVTDETVVPLDCKRATVAMPADEWDSFRDHMLDIGMTLISEKVEIDNKAIREAIQDTGGIPGAHIGERSEHIEVK